MATKQCPISRKNMLISEMVKVNEHHYFDPFTLKQLINSVCLGISIDIANQDEWIITALNDTVDNSSILRLRNPLTNIGFTQKELFNIYSSLSLSDGNKRRLRSSV